MRLISRLEIAAIDFPFEKKARGESKDRGKVVETASSSGIDKWKPENIGWGGGYLALLSPVPPFRRSWTPLTRGRIRVSLPKFLRPYSPPSRGLCLEVIFLRRSKVEPRVSASIHVQFKKIFYKIVRALHSFLSFHLDFKIPRKNQEKEKKSKQNSYIIIRSFLKSRISKKLFSKEFLSGGREKNRNSSLVRRRKRRAVSTLFLLLLLFSSLASPFDYLSFLECVP